MTFQDYAGTTTVTGTTGVTGCDSHEFEATSSSSVAVDSNLIGGNVYFRMVFTHLTLSTTATSDVIGPYTFTAC